MAKNVCDWVLHCGLQDPPGSGGLGRRDQSTLPILNCLDTSKTVFRKLCCLEMYYMGQAFPGGSDSKESASNAGDPGSTLLLPLASPPSGHQSFVQLEPLRGWGGADLLLCFSPQHFAVLVQDIWKTDRGAARGRRGPSSQTCMSSLVDWSLIANTLFIEFLAEYRQYYSCIGFCFLIEV